MKTKTLNEYKKNVFSQNGEDGITEEILKRIGISTGTCVEFGASDGVVLSNTALLWMKRGWKAVLIESQDANFKTLTDIIKGYQCKAVQAMVVSKGDSSIESILTKEKVNFKDVKVMSIDIDGDEYHVLEGLTSLKPSILIVEYNPTIPPEMHIVSREGFGSSVSALSELAAKKGYILVTTTKTNCFFVDSKFSSAFDDIDTTFEKITDRSCLTYLITGYDGSYAFSQNPAFSIGLPLHKNMIEQGKLFFIGRSHIRVRLNRVKHSIKMMLKNVISHSIIERFRFTKSYILWKLKGMPVPAHGYYKRDIFKSYRNKHGIDTFVETGTAGGGTVIALRKDFKKLYTIELDPTLYQQGRAKTAKYQNIECLEGDSGTILKEILRDLNAPALFWLDAHYSGHGTAKAAIDTPIVQELQQIFSHGIKKHVIVIDDMREFNGTNDYPTLEELKAIISEKAPEYTATQKNDLLVIESKNFVA